MDFVLSQESSGISTLMLNRGKVNALNGTAVDQLRAHLKRLESDPEVRSIILTGFGKFFSFGFDIPEFLSFTKEQFLGFLENFTDLCTYLFLYPKPVIAALNGHTIAGVWLRFLHYRVMVIQSLGYRSMRLVSAPLCLPEALRCCDSGSAAGTPQPSSIQEQCTPPRRLRA
jgi:hypothetical protein